MASATGVFTPLGPNEFRLIRVTHVLNSAPGEHERIIVCQLAKFLLDQPPPFKAISYTWDSARYDVKKNANGIVVEFLEPPILAPIVDRIIVNKKFVSVNRNLCLGIENLLNHGAIDTSAWFWVDALCINQNDVDEKSQQVALLHKFFPAATEVLVWLGDSGLSREHEERLAQFIVDFIPALRRAESVLNSKLFDLFVPLDQAVIEAISIEKLEHRVMDLLMFLRTHRWFHRLWTCPEYATARNDRIFYGSVELPAGDFFQTCGHLNMSGWGRQIAQRSVSPAFATSELFEPVGRLDFVSQFSHAKSWLDICRTGLVDRRKDFGMEYEWTANVRAVTLSFLLTWQSVALCSDPRDKVYGNQGLIEAILNDASLLFTPDYTATVEEIYVRTCKQLLYVSKNLDVLTFSSCLARSSRPDLPSWVVDYRDNERVGHGFSLQNGLNLGGGLRTSVVFEEDAVDALRVLGHRLECHGIHIDHIAEVPGFTLDSTEHWIFDAVECTKAATRLVTDRRCIEILWRTLILDRDRAHDYDPPEEKMEVCFWHWVVSYSARGILEQDAQRFEGLLVGLEPASFTSSREILDDLETFVQLDNATAAKAVESEWTTDTQDLEDRAQAIERSALIFLSNMDLTWKYYKLFFTANGVLGLTHASVRSDDEVWMLKTATHPWIIRPTGEAGVYTFVSPCFILPGQIDLPTKEGAKKLIKPVTLI